MLTYIITVVLEHQATAHLHGLQVVDQFQDYGAMNDYYPLMERAAKTS